MEKVLRSLTKLPLAFRKEYESTIQSMLHKLEAQEAICNLFHRLNPLFTFIDYKLLHHLVMKLGSPGLQKDMVIYTEMVQLFKKVTTISELIDYWPGLKVPQINHKVLRAKFEADPKSYTLESWITFEITSIMNCGSLSLSQFPLSCCWNLLTHSLLCGLYLLWLLKN